MKVKDLLKVFEDRGIHGDMNIRVIVNSENPEDEDFDEFFNTIEVWGWENESCVDLFVSSKEVGTTIPQGTRCLNT